MKRDEELVIKFFSDSRTEAITFKKIIGRLISRFLSDGFKISDSKLITTEIFENEDISSSLWILEWEDCIQSIKKKAQ